MPTLRIRHWTEGTLAIGSLSRFEGCRSLSVHQCMNAIYIWVSILDLTSRILGKATHVAHNRISIPAVSHARTLPEREQSWPRAMTTKPRRISDVARCFLTWTILGASSRHLRYDRSQRKWASLLCVYEYPHSDAFQMKHTHHRAYVLPAEK